MSDEPAAASTGSAEFDLHGIVGVKLVNAEARDVRAVAKQLGPIRGSLGRPADITIRFVDSLKPRQPLQILGMNEAGFTDEGFLILQHKSRPLRARIPFDQIGGPCEILCEHGAAAVPLLIAIINLTALAKGYVPLHAGAFNYEGVGAVVTGWSKGGKTETLLGFLTHGAQYVGDEWVYLAPDGRRVFGIPEPIRIWDWHLTDLPHIRGRLSWKMRTRLAILKKMHLLASALGKAFKQKSGAAKVCNKIAAILKRQVFIDVTPEELCGGAFAAQPASFDHLLFVASHDSPETVTRPIDPLEVAERMVASLEYERMPLLTYYRMAQFALPGLRNHWVEEAEQRQLTLLERAFDGKPAHIVLHPYPAPIPAMYDAISGALKTQRTVPAAAEPAHALSGGPEQ